MDARTVLRVWFAVGLVAAFGSANAQIDMWYIPASYSGSVANDAPLAQCLVPGLFGPDPETVASNRMSMYNAVTTSQCWQTCRNPATHVSTRIVDDKTAIGRLRSVCTGSEYEYTITKISQPKQPSCDPSETAANPCNLANGAKVQRADDYLDPAGDLTLYRIYNSLSAELSTSMFGRSWQSNFDKRALGFGNAMTAAQVRTMPAVFWRPGGRALLYAFDAAQQAWKSDADITERATQLVSADGNHDGWLLENGSSRERYDAQGRLTAIEDERGSAVSLTYGPTGFLTNVTDKRGRSLTFNIASPPLVSSVTLPDGKQITFTYTAGVLTRATYPDSTPATSADNPAVKYAYEKAGAPHLLTGIVDEANNRSSSWDYDTSGRVILSTHGDPSSQIDRVAISYGADGSAAVLQPLGKQTTLGFTEVLGVRRMAAASGACPSCNGGSHISKTYDANGNPDRQTDLSGAIADFDYDQNGLLTQKVEASTAIDGTKRTIRTDWLVNLRVPAERLTYDAGGALVARSTWTYNARGQVLAASVFDPASGLTRTTTTTYCEQADVAAGTCPIVGLTRFIDGPRTDVADVQTYQYYAADHPGCATTPATCHWRKGDLWKVSNAAGQVTETLAYDGAGRTLSVKDGNGVITDYEYHPRGWLAARKIRGSN